MEFRIAFIFLALLSSSFCSITFGSLSDVTPESKPVKPELPPVADNSTLAPTTTIKTSVAPETTTGTTTVAPKTTETTTVTPKTTVTTTVAPETTTTVKPTPDPKTTTETPKTTSSTTVKPTPDPKTTTETPKTTSSTTVKPTPDPKTTTETPKTTSSTTVKPTDAPTTLAPVTTTIAPQPAKAGVWFVEKDNVTCIIAKILIDVNVTYPAKNGTKNIILVSVEGTNATAVNGTCGNQTESISVPLVGGHTLELTFVSNETSKRYAVDSTKLTVNVTALPDLKDNVTELVYGLKSPLFDTALTKSYKCNNVQSLNLTSSANWTAVLKVKDTQLEAFRQDSIVKFGDAQDCETADTPDIVPIAVGVSLGVMILIVLVAYLVGRRRPITNGYVSM